MVLLDDDAIHHHVDRVIVVLVEIGLVGGQIDRFAVDLHPTVSRRDEFLEEFLEGALLIANHGRSDFRPRPSGQLEEAIDHRFCALFADSVATLRTMGNAHSSVQQPQIIV